MNNENKIKNKIKNNLKEIEKFIIPNDCEEFSK